MNRIDRIKDFVWFIRSCATLKIVNLFYGRNLIFFHGIRISCSTRKVQRLHVLQVIHLCVHMFGLNTYHM